MAEFDCARCGIHVILVIEDQHPENIYCLQCRFIESLEDPEEQRAVEEFLNRPREGS